MKKYLIGITLGTILLLTSCSSSSNASYGRLQELGTDNVGGVDVTIFKDEVGS